MTEAEIQRTKKCPDCGADGDKDQAHVDNCFRGKGWNHAIKTEDEQG